MHRFNKIEINDAIKFDIKEHTLKGIVANNAAIVAS